MCSGEVCLSASHLHLDQSPPTCLVSSHSCSILSRWTLQSCDLHTEAVYPLASDTGASGTFPLSSSLPHPCLDPAGCISYSISLLILVSVPAKPYSSFANPDPALKSHRHGAPISCTKICLLCGGFHSTLE